MKRKKNHMNPKIPIEKRYTYHSTMYEDLIDEVIEYLGEMEHQTGGAQMGELSQDTVVDLKAWVESRKIMLAIDFAYYLLAVYENEAKELPLCSTPLTL